MIDRRAFLQLGAATLLAGCQSSRHTEEDAARLARQQAEEKANSGRGRLGPLRYAGYRGLAELPWFELGEDGFLHSRIELPPTVDMHTHLGWSYFLAPRVDLLRRTSRIQYLMDCDAEEPPCPLDLDVYVNSNFTEAMHSQLSWETMTSLLTGSRAAATHTVPNLVAEMDALGVAEAAVLPIATNLPLSGDNSLASREAIVAGGATKRLIPFASVHPDDPKAREKLREAKRAGVRGVKLHPEMQRFFPDAPGAMAIYEECGKLGLPVIFHAGRSGIEPDFLKPYALLRYYVPGIREFPQVKFLLGHAGARDVAEALLIARDHRNVWLELSSQGASSIDHLLQELGPEKLVFGSDWPFYPLAVALAKVLLVTGDDAGAQRQILGGNAHAILEGTGEETAAAGRSAGWTT